MNKKPVISIIIPAVRPQYWIEVHDSLNCKSKFPFETIFLGDVKPNYTLPANSRYYYTKVKPAQCVEIGFRLAEGEFAVCQADDNLFVPGYINKLVSYIEKYDMNKTFLVPRGARRWRPKVNSLYWKSKSGLGVVIGITALIKVSLYREMGGIDRRFVFCGWNSDLGMRIIERGGKSIIAYDCIFNEENRGSYLTKEWQDPDIELLEKMWEDSEGNLLYKRQLGLEPYVGTTEELLMKSQGPKGKWE